MPHTEREIACQQLTVQKFMVDSSTQNLNFLLMVAIQSICSTGVSNVLLRMGVACILLLAFAESKNNQLRSHEGAIGVDAGG